MNILSTIKHFLSNRIPIPFCHFEIVIISMYKRTETRRFLNYKLHILCCQTRSMCTVLKLPLHILVNDAEVIILKIKMNKIVFKMFNMARNIAQFYRVESPEQS